MKFFEENFRAMMDEPSLIEPIDIDTSAHSACAIDRDGVVCWGDDDWGIENVPPLNNPVQVELGVDFACAMDDNGVICWGPEGRPVWPPKLENPRSISVGDYHACALDGDGIVCWGSNQWGALDIPDYLRAD
jgi:alpha-tubulin suppressor-like RCC1 family protein